MTATDPHPIDVLDVPERRAHERVSVSLFGRALLPLGIEIPVQATDISPGDLAVCAAMSPEPGERVIVYLDEIGRVEGDCVRAFDGGFAMTLEASARRRERLSAQIAWVKANHEFGVENARKHDRYVPREQNSRLQLTDGRSYPVRIIDLSLSGAAIALDVCPAIGAVVELAGLEGRVVRHFDGGIAIEFERERKADDFKPFGD